MNCSRIVAALLAGVVVITLRDREGMCRDGASQKRLACLERAIVDLQQTFGPKYPRGDEFLSRLNRLRRERIGPADHRRLPVARGDDFQKRIRDALLANPLLDIDRVLVVKRKPQPPGYPFGQRASNAGGPMWSSKSPGMEIGMPWAGCACGGLFPSPAENR